MKICKWSILFGIGLTALTVFMILDTFVIPESELAVTEEDSRFAEITALQEESEALSETVNEPEAEEATETKEASKADETPESEEISASPQITLATYRVNDTDIYVADIVFDSVESLKTAFAQDTYGRKITDKTSRIAENKNAVLAINGDYYGARERGYVIRNGVLYRDTPSDEDVLCIYADGHMEIVDPDEVSAEELLQAGVWQAFSFGPGLLQDGEYLVDQNDEVGRAMASNPRTAIGMIDSNHYVFVVSDGRTDESRGLSLYELAGFMEGLGVKTAYNLDGGGSSTMVYEGQIVNTPANGRHSNERSVSDIVYIEQE
ncbi:MAG: phosphodiester glycosidase family protein [Lachnospiraceae bacterium]|nr:phosphodiester glycosidase family protein [Lachnospiraceae bacterium]